jgi:hypothetical protein
MSKERKASGHRSRLCITIHAIDILTAMDTSPLSLIKKKRTTLFESWWCGSRELAEQEQGPEIKHQHHQKQLFLFYWSFFPFNCLLFDNF